MGLKKLSAALALSVSLFAAGAARATDIEVTHWWTSGGEAAAVAEFEKKLMLRAIIGLMVLLLVQATLLALSSFRVFSAATQWVPHN